MKRIVSIALSAALLLTGLNIVSAEEQNSVYSAAENGKYTWNFAYDENDSGRNVFDLSDEYADLRIALGEGDSITEDGIYWSDSSCKEPPTSAEDSHRYILVRPEYDGAITLTIRFTNATNSAKGRIWSNDLGTEVSLDEADLTALQKGVGNQLGSDFTGTYEDTVSFNVEAGHTYSLHTYNRTSYISEMYYTSEEIVGKTAAPVINGPVLDSDTAVSGTCADGAEVMVSINGAEPQAAEVSGTEWSLSGLTLSEGDVISVTAQAGDYKESSAAVAVVAANDSTCSLTIEPSEHGTVVSDQENNDRIMKGTKVVLTAVPDEKYRLSYIAVNGEPKEADENGSISFIMNEDVTVTSEFEEKPYHTIAMPESTANGSVSIESGAITENGIFKAIEGDTVTFSVEPETGYRIKTLTYRLGDGEPVEIKYSNSLVMPEGDITIDAEFKEEAVVSYVDTSFDTYDRLTLTVDDEPFFYSGIQVRADNAIDKLKFNDEQVRDMYLQAGKDRFTVVNSQVRWTDVQPETELWATETGQMSGSGNTPSAGSVTATGTDAAYFTFELPEIEEGAEYAAVKFRIRVSGVTSGTALSIYDATDGTMSEEKVTSPDWDLVTTEHLGNTDEGSNGYFDFNVADFVNLHKNDGKITLAVKCENDSSVTIYGSGSEGNDRPQLKLSRDDIYDWTYLDTLLDNAYAAGVKFELLWFATDTCQQSHEERVPYYVHENYQKSLKADGTPARRLGADNIYIMCKNDLKLRAKEKEVLETVFDHIAEYDAEKGYGHVVVGCQVANETAVGRLHSGTDDNKYFGHCYCDTCMEKLAEASSESAFREETLWGYLNNLGSAVKESNYSVWTRHNNYMTTDTNVLAYNEQKRNTTGTNLDFIGVDPYSITGGADHDYIYSFGHETCTYRNHTYNYAQGDNLPLVMEFGGNNRDLDESVIACIAGGGYLNVYELLSGSEDYGTYVAVRDSDGNAAGFEPRTGYTYSSGSEVNWSEENWIDRIRNMNGMLGKVKYQIASKRSDGAGGDELMFFNPKSDETASSSKKIRALDVTYNTGNNGVGIAIDESETEIVLLSTKASGFVIDGLSGYGIEAVETGYFDKDKWISEGAKEYTEADGNVSVAMDAYECVKITVNSPIPKAPVIEAVSGSAQEGRYTWAFGAPEEADGKGAYEHSDSYAKRAAE